MVTGIIGGGGKKRVGEFRRLAAAAFRPDGQWQRPPIREKVLRRAVFELRHCLSPHVFTILDHYCATGEFRIFRSPVTFNERLQHKKLFDMNPLYVLTADKYEVRDYVASRIGQDYLIPLYLVATDARAIRADTLPNAFALKATHGSNMNLLVRDKKQIDWDEVVTKAGAWLETNFFDFYKEWAYKHMTPRIIAEELLLGDDNSPPNDYKFLTFNGKVRLIDVHVDRFGKHAYSLFDEDWRPLAVDWGKGYPRSNLPVKKPKNLEEMIAIAEILGSEFEFARIDLYDHNGRIYFGEITHYPNGRTEIFDPPAFDRAMGDVWAHGAAISDSFFALTASAVGPCVPHEVQTGRPSCQDEIATEARELRPLTDTDR